MSSAACSHNLDIVCPNGHKALDRLESLSSAHASDIKAGKMHAALASCHVVVNGQKSWRYEEPGCRASLPVFLVPVIPRALPISGAGTIAAILDTSPWRRNQT
jgi:hypothetical protein